MMLWQVSCTSFEFATLGLLNVMKGTSGVCILHNKVVSVFFNLNCVFLDPARTIRFLSRFSICSTRHSESDLVQRCGRQLDLETRANPATHLQINPSVLQLAWSGNLPLALFSEST